MLSKVNTSKNIELDSLYQEVILDHSRCPRFKSKSLSCHFCQEGKNPLCGDNLVVYCKINNENEHQKLSVGFDGAGCSISQASASIMCESLQNVTFDEAKKRLEYAENIYTGKIKLSANNSEQDIEQDIEALYGVSKFPVRIKCAALAWKTLEVLLSENFDESGSPKSLTSKSSHCAKLPNQQKKLKIVST